MSDHRIEDDVTMGKLKRYHTDNAIRIFTHKDITLLQLRYKNWYLIRQLSNEDIIELIQALSTVLLERTKEVEKV
jgi:hypothetical protein